jgi:carbon storage regulator
MLVLSRKLGESVVINGNIRITVADIGNGRVKIGVTAPREVHVARAELAPKPVIVETADDAHLERILAERARLPEFNAARQ